MGTIDHWLISMVVGLLIVQSATLRAIELQLRAILERLNDDRDS